MSDQQTIPVEARHNSAVTVLTPTTRRGDRHLAGMWVPVKNEPGEMRRIDKNLLMIDPRYQRRVDERFVARVAANWSWVSCGVLEVSRRPGADKWFIFEGQHRWRAAILLPEVKDIPCIVFQLDTVRDEAIGFLAANTERKTPTVRDRFRALLMAGDPIANKMNSLITTYSREVGTAGSSQTIVCVSAMMRMMTENTKAMERVFPVIADIAAGQPIHARLAWAFHHLERAMPHGQSLSDKRWFEIIRRTGYAEITTSIRNLAAIDLRGGPPAYAMGLLRAINKGLRNPLEVNLETLRR